MGNINRIGGFVVSKFWHRLWEKVPDLTGLGAMIIATVLTSSVLLGVRELGGIQRLELIVFDSMMRLRPDEEPDPRLLVVGITEEDIEVHGWPLSDQVLAQLLGKLQSYQPRLIGLDLYRNVPQPPGHEEFLQQLKATNIIAIRDDAGKVGPPPSMPPEQIGFNDLVADPDGAIRRSLMTFNSKGTTQISFSLRLAYSYLESKKISPKTNSSGQILWGKATFEQLQSNSGGYKRIDAGGYQILLNYRSGRNLAPVVSVSEILSGSVPREWVQDKIVLIGSTAPSLKDVHFTPYSPGENDNPMMPGVIIHGQMLSQMLSAVMDGRPLFWFWPEWVEGWWLIGWAVVGGMVAMFCRHPVILGLTGTAMVGVLVGSCWGIFLQAGWVPVFSPMMAYLVTGGFVVAHRAYQAGRQQQVVMKLLGQNTSPEIADALWKSRDRLLKDGRMPGQKLMATMLFTDLKSFSTISEQMPPEMLMEWLNEYLGALTETVQAHHGIINKFTGDGIMAAFGVPVARSTDAEIAEDARNAVACGLAMGDRLAQMNEQWARQRFPVVQMRVGIFTGPVVAGTLGGKERSEYGIIGDSVNIASRLESCEKDRQDTICRVLIAQETLVYLQDEFEVESWGPLALKGKHQTVEVYRVISRRVISLPETDTKTTPEV